MNRYFRLLLSVAALLALSGIFARPAAAQNGTGVKDSVYLIEQITGQPYECCYGFILKSRQYTPQKIDEFTVRILDSHAKLIPGQGSSAPGWTIFQYTDSVRWLASTNSAELDSNEEANGFNVCARDTGVTRLVWETRYLGALVSRDTIVLVCRGTFCDEPFFNIMPSGVVCAYTIDLVAANPDVRVVNDFHLRLLDSGFTFNTALGSAPSGWSRVQAKSDSMAFRTFTAGLNAHEFVEGFRVYFNSPKKDTTFRVEWWTTNFGDTLCRGVVTLKCAIGALDTFRLVKSLPGDTCCRDITLLNSHFPTSKLDRFAVKVLTPKAKLMPTITAAAGWTTAGVNATGDSISFAANAPMSSGDSALFTGACFDNDSAATDTIRYQMESFSKGIPVTSTTGFQICERRQLNCDTVIALVDSTYPASKRCMSFTVKNTNSRGDEIQRIVFRPSNEGAKRTIVSAKGPVGTAWQTKVAGDSVVFFGSYLSRGEVQPGFDICLSLGDSTTKDPVSIYFATSNDERFICSDTLRVNAIIERLCDELVGEELPGDDKEACCFEITVHNLNQFNRDIDRLYFSIPGSKVIFNSGVAPTGWTVGTEAFPNFNLEFAGGNIAPGDSAKFQFCLNVQQLGNKPFNIPAIAWTTYSGKQLICVDTLRLVCRGVEPVEPMCDTVKVSGTTRDDEHGICSYKMVVVNRHNQPSGPIDGVRLKITGGTGGFAEASAGIPSWSVVTLSRDELLFRGSNIRSLDSLDTFIFNIDSSDGGVIPIEATTFQGDAVVCTHTLEARCEPATVGVELPEESLGFNLYENRPNPFSNQTVIRYVLRRPGDVTLSVRDGAGAEVRRVDRGGESVGEHSLIFETESLPSGVYYYTLTVGAQSLTRRMVIVR